MYHSIRIVPVLASALLVAAGAAACGRTSPSSNEPTPSPSSTIVASSMPSPTPASNTPSSAPTSPASSPTPPPGTLEITQLGIRMQIPQGIDSVLYQLEPTTDWVFPDNAGVSHQALSVVYFATPEWTALAKPSPPCWGPYSGAPEMVVSVWDVDPAGFQGRGQPFSAAALVGGRYLLITPLGDPYDVFGCGGSETSSAMTLSDRQSPLLRKMVSSASAG